MKSNFTHSGAPGQARTVRIPGGRFWRLTACIATLLATMAGNKASAQYCTTSSSCGIDYISNVVTTGGSTNISNNTGGCGGTNGYNDFTTTKIHTGVQGTTVNFTVTIGGDYEATSIWVDFNNNQSFADPGENVYNGPIVAPGISVSGSFTIPIGATPGTTRMRVRCNYQSTNAPACGATTYGEVEDYGFVVVAAVPCAGTPTGGTAVASPATVCPGATSNLSVTGASLTSGLTYQWQTYNGTAWVPVAGATSATYTTPPITASTQYRLEITCNAAPTTPAYSTPVTVAPTVITLPYTETFESITANNQLPNCMTATNLGTLTLTYTANQGSYNRTNHTTGGSKFASFRYGANDWFFTPGLQLQAGTTYLVSFWYITDGLAGWQQLRACYGTSPTPFAMTSVIGTPVNNLMNTTYQQYTGTFTPTTTGTYNIGIGLTSSTAPWYVTIDDINVQQLLPCAGQPTAGSITPSGPIAGCPGTTYSFNTTGTSIAANLQYQWLMQTNATAPAWTPVPGGIGGTTPNYTTPPLSDTVRYRMMVTCTNSNLTDTTAAVTINVPRPVYATLPYTESFESWVNRCSTTDVPSLNWSNFPATGNNSWRREDQGSSAAWTSPTSGPYTPPAAVGSHSARWHEYYASPVTSPGSLSLYVDCSAQTGPKELQFYIRTDPGLIYPADSVNVFLSTDGGANFTQIGAYGPGTGGWDYKTLTFTSNTATTVIRFDGKANYMYYSDIGLDYVRVLPPCSGKPVAGSITPVTPCINQNFTLSTTGTSQVAGLTYQWQQKSGANWVNVIPGNTATITQNINTATTYRVIVTCAASSQADTTAPFTANLAPFYVCYCNSQPAIAYTSYSDIGNVNVKTYPANVQLMTNGVASPLLNNPNATGMYSNFTTTVPPVQVYQDSFYRLSVTQISQTSFLASTVAAFIDYNQDGIFNAASERVFYKVTSTPTQEVNDTFHVPASALVGITGMRVIIEYGTNVVINPCGIYNTYGETEDYLINVQYPPCDGPSNPGTAFISDTAICPGYTVDLGDTTYEKQRSALIRNWQTSINQGAFWTNIQNSTNKDTLQNQLVMAPTMYRLRMICPVTHDTTYSNAVSVKMNLPYQCYPYSQSSGGKDDSSDIGAFQIGKTIVTNPGGGPHLNNPAAIRKRTDNTLVPGIILNADSTYKLGLYHIMRNNLHADARISVFMDFNNNLQYEAGTQAFPFPNERIFTIVTSANTWYIDTVITIPNTVIPNVPTGMRVILNNDVNPNSPANLGFGSYVSGETEDYVVVFRRDPAGISKTGNLRDLAVYPNPTEGRFTILANSLKPVNHVDVTVTTLTGQKVITRSFDNSGTQFTAEMDLTGQARGVYFVEVRADGEKVVSKLVVH